MHLCVYFYLFLVGVVGVEGVDEIEILLDCCGGFTEDLGRHAVVDDDVPDL